MVVCPRCGHSLKVRETNDYPVDPETGEADTNTGDYDLTDVRVVCTHCAYEDVTEYFTNDEGELDIDGGVWRLASKWYVGDSASV